MLAMFNVNANNTKTVQFEFLGEITRATEQFDYNLIKTMFPTENQCSAKLIMQLTANH